MFKAQAPNNQDYIGTILEELTNRELILNGRFTQQIADYNSARAQAEEKLGMVLTVEQAAKTRIDADAYAASVRGSADKTQEAAANALAGANGKMAAALEKEKSVASREAQALAIMEEYERRAKAFDQDCAKREAALAVREAALTAAQAKLAADASNLAEKQQAVLQKLEAAKALAGTL